MWGTAPDCFAQHTFPVASGRLPCRAGIGITLALPREPAGKRHRAGRVWMDTGGRREPVTPPPGCPHITVPPVRVSGCRRGALPRVGRYPGRGDRWARKRRSRTHGVPSKAFPVTAGTDRRGSRPRVIAPPRAPFALHRHGLDTPQHIPLTVGVLPPVGATCAPADGRDLAEGWCATLPRQPKDTAGGIKCPQQPASRVVHLLMVHGVGQMAHGRPQVGMFWCGAADSHIARPKPVMLCISQSLGMPAASEEVLRSCTPPRVES